MWSPDAALLAALRSSSQYLPIGELAAQAKLTVPQAAEHLETLRAAGFEIEQHPTLGCHLLKTPDRLMADDLWARLSLDPCGEHLLREILVLEETGSTNDLAASLGRQGVAGGVLILAESQTAGRGRFGRQWVSASHRGIWMSLLLRPPWPAEDWPRLTTWAAVAVATAIDRFCPIPSTIKWPNDVLIAGRKAAGILIEMGADCRGDSFAVVGIGLNANHEPLDFPPELAGTAQSIRMVTGAPIDRADLLVALLKELQTRWETAGLRFERLIAEAEWRSALVGRWVQVRQGHELLAGRVEGLGEKGHLLLRTGHGELLRLSAGEVTFHDGGMA